jgi:glycosyltransferase involved in cell wall biosynthesis
LVDRLRVDGIPVWIGPSDPYGPPPSAIPSGLTTFRKVVLRIHWGLWAARIMIRRRPRLVYVNTLRGATAALAAACLRIPIIWHLRGLETGTSNAAYRRLRLKVVGLLSRRIVAVCRAVADAAQAAGCPPGKVCVAHNSIDAGALNQAAADQFPRVSLPPELTSGLVVGYVGRLDPHKGVLEFLDSAGRLATGPNPPGFLLIGGPCGAANADWHRIGPALEQARVRGARIHVTGFTDQPYGLMLCCDILVLPSHDEGFPRVVLEAMALGKAIVATAVGGVPEAITSDTHGILTPPKDPARLAAAIARLVSDPALRERVGREARIRVAHAFTPEATVEAVLDALRAAIPG